MTASDEATTLLVLDNALDHDFYRPVDHWAQAAGFTPASVHVSAGHALPDPDRYTHVIVSGSEDTITERPEWAEEEARWLVEAVDSGIAVLGSCWGHQLIARALAGEAAVRRSATPEFGWLEVGVSEPAGLLPGLRFQAFVSHFDEVVPGCHRDMRPLASTAGCAIQAMRWADLPVWGIQAHPEIDEQTGRTFLEEAQSRWPENASTFARGLKSPVLDSRSVRQIVQRFIGTRRRAG